MSTTAERDIDMTRLRLRMFGGLVIRHANSGRPFAFSRRKAAALIAVLAKPAGKPRSREELADMLWSLTGEQGARNNLRQTLYMIRRTIGDFDGLEINRDSLAIAPKSISSDVDEFLQASNSDSLRDMERAANLYTGDFLNGFSLREDPFEAWKATQREQLRAVALSVYEQLMKIYADQGRIEDACRLARRSIAIDPAHEPAHQILIDADVAKGRIGLARRTFDQLSEKLRTEFGIEPNQATRATLAKRSFHGVRQSSAATTGTQHFARQFADGPIVGVLPFQCADDISHALCNALTPKVITCLAAALRVQILDHHSLSAVRARSSTTGELVAETGADYLIEGSLVRRSDRFQANFTLIETATKRHIASGSDERAGSDLFQMAEDFSQTIAATMAYQFEMRVRQRWAARAVDRSGAWPHFNHGMALLDLLSHSDIIPAQQAFDKALEIEPSNARVIAGMSQAVLQEGICLVGRTRDEAFPLALDLALQAYALDRNDPFVNWSLGKAYHRSEQFEPALDAFRQALSFYPENQEIAACLGNLLGFMGKPTDAISLAVRSLASTDVYLTVIARCHLQSTDYRNAVRLGRRTVRLHPNNSWAYVVMGSAYGHLGRSDEALAALHECERIHPGRVNAEFGVRPTQYADPREQDHILAGLLKAGWRP